MLPLDNSPNKKHQKEDMTELLAPAGTLEHLKWAVEYGADAVYFGMPNFSLRSYAGNFTLEDVAAGLNYLHARGKRGYVTLNIYPFTNEYDGLLQTAAGLAELGVDAFIAADLGVIQALITRFPDIPVHVSTQANTVSAQTALSYQVLGATRVNLARELSMVQITELLQIVAGRIETEVFIHGSVCFSYSGRCAISDYLTGRRANRGECTQACRWNYKLLEEKRPDVYFPVFEDERGLYLFNSKDLALYRYVHALVDMGISSLKIEGRMKNAHYLAAVVSLYRRLLDGDEIPEATCQQLLSRVSNRGYSEGFMKGGVTEDDYQTDFGGYHATSTLIAHTTEVVTEQGRICVVKNSLNAGESLELLTPDGQVQQYTVPAPITTIDGEFLTVAQNHHTVLLDVCLPAYAILRRVEGE